MKHETEPQEELIGDDLGIALRIRTVLPEALKPLNLFERFERHVLSHKIEIPLAAVALTGAGVALGAVVAGHNHNR